MATMETVAVAGIPRGARGDEAVHLRLREPLTVATAAWALDLLREYVRLGRVRLLLDLEMVPAIDVCGVAALLRAQRLLEAEGGVLLLRPNPTVRRALEASRTVSVFRLLATVAPDEQKRSGLGAAIR